MEAGMTQDPVTKAKTDSDREQRLRENYRHQRRGMTDRGKYSYFGHRAQVQAARKHTDWWARLERCGAMIDEQWGRCQNTDDIGERCDQPGDWYSGTPVSSGVVLCPDCAADYGMKRGDADE